jgi:hypothetical protein
MKLDDDLRHAAGALDRIEVDPPTLDLARRRRRRRQTSRGVGAFVGVIVLVGAAYLAIDAGARSEGLTVKPPAASGEKTPRVTVVPWADVTTTTFVEPTMPAVPPIAPPCRTADIEVTIGPPTRFMQGPSAHLLQFTNIGQAACSLTGNPTVTATGSDGRKVTATPADLMPEIGGPQLEADVLPVGTFSSTLLWNPFDCAQSPSATELDVSFGDRPVVVDAAPSAAEKAAAERGGFSVPDIPPVPTGCGLQINPFSVAQAGRTYITPMDRLGYRLDGDSEVRVGGTLALTLTLRNTTARPIPLMPCSDYQGSVSWQIPGQMVLRDAQFHGQLRCDSVGSIEPGTTVAFELHVDVPSTARPGPGVVFLGLDTPSLTPVHLFRQLTILPG